MLNYNTIEDQDFLLELDQYHHKFFWTKIIALNWDEEPVEEITGRITSGSINIDGKSAVRRTCSLNLVANEVNLNDFYWGLNTKFRVLIGLENHINPIYPDIIWFNQGIFLISSFKTSLSTNNFTISISGRDKMCLLNGEIGGAVPASWDFGKIDDVFTGKTEYYPIKQIITQAVHEFAQEPWQNIIVNDLDDYGLELLEYTGEVPLYYIIHFEGDGVNDSREVYQVTRDAAFDCWVRQDTFKDGERKQGAWKKTTISEIEEDASGNKTGLYYEKLLEKLDPGMSAIDENTEYLRAIISLVDPTTEEFTGELFTVVKISKDLGTSVCGYRVCDIIYPYDLIASPGESITSILDKLVQMLGNFEYFYNENGQFIFQRKRTYLDINFNNIINEHNNSINEEVWVAPSELTPKYSYIFDDSSLISSISNSPNLSNLKNDYSIWADRKVGDIAIPIHMRYAIDKKPYFYKAIGNEILRDDFGFAYISMGEGDDQKTVYLEYYDINSDSIKKVGDYEKIQETHVGDENYEYNYQYTNEGVCYVTEDYYNILFPDDENIKVSTESPLNVKIVDWREIIYQMANDYRMHYREEDFLEKIRNNNTINWSDGTVTYLYQKGFTGYEKYYIDFEMNLSDGAMAYWRELYNPNAIGDNNADVETEGDIVIPNEEDGEIITVSSGTEEVSTDVLCLYENKKFYNVEEDIPTFAWDGVYEPYSLVKVKDGDSYKFYRFRYKPSKEELDDSDNLRWPNELISVSKNTNVEELKAEKVDLESLLQASYIANNVDRTDELNNIKNFLNLKFRQSITAAESITNLENDKKSLTRLKNDSNAASIEEKIEDIEFRIKLAKQENDKNQKKELLNSMLDVLLNSSIDLLTASDENSEFIDINGIISSKDISIYYKYIQNFISDLKNNVGLDPNEKEDWIEIISPDTDINAREAYYQELEKDIQNELNILENKSLSKILNNDHFWVRIYPDVWTFSNTGWNKDILNSPENLNFWFDFIDTTGELNKYAVQNIGQRAKVEKDDKVKAIYFREIPNVIFTTKKSEEVNTRWVKPGYAHVNIPRSIADWFTLSTRGKTMIDKIEELLYNYTFSASALSITTVPILHLTPNTLIYLNNPDIGAVGEYALEKYSIQLGLVSQMTLSATETAKRLY